VGRANYKERKQATNLPQRIRFDDAAVNEGTQATVSVMALGIRVCVRLPDSPRIAYRGNNSLDGHRSSIISKNDTIELVDSESTGSMVRGVT
jgi:hypothetical protein